MIMAAWVSMIWSSAERPQVPAISIGGVMLPISMARTCCMAWGKATPQEGFPSNWRSAALVWDSLLMFFLTFLGRAYNTPQTAKAPLTNRNVAGAFLNDTNKRQYIEKP